jgi:uncharacterized membrane protein
MSYKKYLLFRLLAAAIVAALAVWGSTTGNLLVLIPAVVVIGIILLTMRKKVTEVVVDERVNAVAYRATRLAFLVFIYLAVIAGLVLVWVAEDASDTLFHVGLTLDYSACALLLFYWAAYAYYNRKYGGNS